MYIIDAYAWIEYFKGSKKGENAAKVIDSQKTRTITLECTLAEIKGWALREDVDFKKLHDVVVCSSDIVHITAEDWLDAAEMRFEMRKKVPDFGFIDALILAVQKRTKYKVLTGDPHFRDLKDTVFLQ